MDDGQYGHDGQRFFGSYSETLKPSFMPAIRIKPEYPHIDSTRLLHTDSSSQNAKIATAETSKAAIRPGPESPWPGEAPSGWQSYLFILFGPEHAVPGVTEARHNIAMVIEAFVNSGRINFNIGMTGVHEVDAFGSGHQTHKLDILRPPLF